MASAVACVLEVLEPRQLLDGLSPGDTMILGERFYASGLDQPQLTAVMTDGGEVIRDSLGRIIPFDPYIDTGASAFVISHITAQGYTATDLFGDVTTVEGLSIGTLHGSLIGVYTDAGVGGPETGDVTSPLGLLLRNGMPLAETIDPDTFEIIPPVIDLAEFVNVGQYNLWVRQQEGYGEHLLFMGFDLGVQPLDVIGMPVIEQYVMVMDPTTIGADPEGLFVTRMETELLHEGSPLPGTNLTFRLAMQDFSGAQPPAGETFPSHARNPMFQDVAVTHTANGTMRTLPGQSWLFDTGSTSTMISFAHAQELGLIDEGYADFDSFMADFDGITMPIGGIGCIDEPVTVPLLTVDQIAIPAADGTTVVWQNVDVLVLDAAGLDGVVGLNLLLPAITMDLSTLTELGRNAGLFDAIVFDVNADNTADLRLHYDPADVVVIPGAPTIVSTLPAPIHTGGYLHAVPVTQIGLTVSEALDGIDANAPTNYELRGRGPDNAFDTGDDDIYALTPAYTNGTTFVTLNIAGSALAPGHYRLTARGSTTIHDLAGLALDGDSDGVPGGDYVRDFRVLLPGDANADDRVDVRDLATLAINYNGVGADWTLGDFNGNGEVNVQDLAILALNYNRAPPPTAPGAPVPALTAGVAAEGTVQAVTVPSPTITPATLPSPAVSNAPADTTVNLLARPEIDRGSALSQARTTGSRTPVDQSWAPRADRRHNVLEDLASRRTLRSQAATPATHAGLFRLTAPLQDLDLLNVR